MTMAASAVAGARDATCLELLVCFFFLFLFIYYTNFFKIPFTRRSGSAAAASAAMAAAAATSAGLET